MKFFRKLDAALEKTASLLVEQPYRPVMKLLLYIGLAAAAIGIPYSLVKRVETSGFYLVTVKREARVGVEVARRLDKDLRLTAKDDPVSLYIQEIGTRITRANNPWQAQFSFCVVKDDRMVNAFAIPGGRIYITTGLLNRLDNEAELAAVLSHEAAHVTHRHYARNIGRRMLMSWVKKFLGSTDRTIMDTGSFLTSNITLLRMRQEDELDADYQGTLYMYDLDYDPSGGITLMKKLLGLEKQMPEQLRVMALTHPPSKERLEAMVNLREVLPEKQGLILGEERFREVVKAAPQEPAANPIPLRQ